MGYRGKVAEQEKARLLRAENRTLAEIAELLGVSKSSVSLWVRDVPFTPSKRRHGPHRRPHAQRVAKLQEIEAANAEGRARFSVLTDEAFFAAGVALYAGEGSKEKRAVRFANTDPEMMSFFCAWLRRFFEPDESRFRVTVYLHEGLDIEKTQRYWSALTGVPLGQFGKAYRAVADPSIRHNKHEHGCAYVNYSCTRTHRRIMGFVRALLSSGAIPG